jgi:hypothetical protein
MADEFRGGQHTRHGAAVADPVCAIRHGRVETLLQPRAGGSSARGIGQVGHGGDAALLGAGGNGGNAGLGSTLGIPGTGGNGGSLFGPNGLDGLT